MNHKKSPTANVNAPSVQYEHWTWNEAKKTNDKLSRVTTFSKRNEQKKFYSSSKTMFYWNIFDWNVEINAIKNKLAFDWNHLKTKKKKCSLLMRTNICSTFWNWEHSEWTGISHSIWANDLIRIFIVTNRKWRQVQSYLVPSNSFWKLWILTIHVRSK